MCREIHVFDEILNFLRLRWINEAVFNHVDELEICFGRVYFRGKYDSSSKLVTRWSRKLSGFKENLSS